MLLITMAIAALVGGAWTVIPAVLRGRYGVNEIITTLMMSFIGIGVANVLVKGPFKTDVGGVARTDVAAARRPLAAARRHPDPRRHHHRRRRDPRRPRGDDPDLGRLRLRVLGENPRAAEHAGLQSVRLTVLAFMLSGGLIALAGAVEILGI